MLDAAPFGEWAGLIISVAAACGIIGKLITASLAKDIMSLGKDGTELKLTLSKEISDLEHALKNERDRISALERFRTGDGERLVRVEERLQNFDKAIERVERGQEKLTETMTDRFDLLADAIRKMRDV